VSTVYDWAGDFFADKRGRDRAFGLICDLRKAKKKSLDGVCTLSEFSSQSKHLPITFPTKYYTRMADEFTTPAKPTKPVDPLAPVRLVRQNAANEVSLALEKRLREDDAADTPPSKVARLNDFDAEDEHDEPPLTQADRSGRAADAAAGSSAVDPIDLTEETDGDDADEEKTDEEDEKPESGPPAINRLFRVRGTMVFMTIPAQATTEGITLDHIRALVVARLGRNAGTVIIGKELHQNGKPHYHVFAQTRKMVNQVRFDWYGNTIGHPQRPIVCNYQKVIDPANCIRYVTKGVAVWKDMHSDGQLWEWKEDANKDDVQALIYSGASNMLERAEPPTVYDHFAKGLFSVIRNAKTPKEALLAAATMMGKETVALRQVSQILKCYELLRVPAEIEGEVWGMAGDERYLSDHPFDTRVDSILELMGKWVANATAVPRRRSTILLVVGPTRIGKTSLVRRVMPSSATYSNGAWSQASFLAGRSVAVFDDLTDMTGTANTTPQAGSGAAEPLKAWVQVGFWRHRVLYSGVIELPCLPVCIVANITPFWAFSPYWAANTTIVKFSSDEGPLYWSPQDPRYKRFQEAVRNGRPPPDENGDE